MVIETEKHTSLIQHTHASVIKLNRCLYFVNRKGYCIQSAAIGSKWYEFKIAMLHV